MLKIDDIFAALMLSLLMLRRIEIKTATPEQHPNVPEEAFRRWRALGLRAFDYAAAACASKVLASLGWYTMALKLGVGAPWFQLGGLLIFVAWAVTLVWSWKLGTDARHLRLELGIVLRRRSAPEPSAGRGPSS